VRGVESTQTVRNVRPGSLTEEVFEGGSQFRELEAEPVGECGLWKDAFAVEQFMAELAQGAERP
jgi:hypothetical protein